MPLHIGEVREELSYECIERVEEYANKHKKFRQPFYIVVCAKTDRLKHGQINATIQHYFERPPAMLGLLVWYADSQKGILDFLPELSFPPDIPLDPSVLSTKSSDFVPSIAEKGEKAKVLLS
jgi:hypothetical protein